MGKTRLITIRPLDGAVWGGGEEPLHSRRDLSIGEGVHLRGERPSFPPLGGFGHVRIHA